SNDRLAYLTTGDVRSYLDELASLELRTRQIGFTGGEPFLNPDFLGSLTLALERGFEVLVLTNGMRPMMRRTEELEPLIRRYGQALEIRVSMDHYTQELHETERGPGAWDPMIQGLQWLARAGAKVTLAGRTRWGEEEASAREGYGVLLRELGVPLDPGDPAQLVLFPEMDETADVPEVSAHCWKKLGLSPADVMCASSRMVVRRKGAEQPAVLACTLIAYDPGFELGATLAQALRPVVLNHPHCSRFCVLGGASCSQR
ncbi:MAG: radical SAM protein, partial [Planctomycetota bacterium]